MPAILRNFLSGPGSAAAGGRVYVSQFKEASHVPIW